MINLIFKKTNKKYLQQFLSSCTDELDHFRYFDKRKLNVIQDQILTNLIFIDKTPIAYFHIEKENNTFWFGICINKKYHQFGIGSLIMNTVISFCKLNNIKTINLTVDADNNSAISLYLKYKFKIKKIKDSTIHMVLDI